MFKLLLRVLDSRRGFWAFLCLLTLALRGPTLLAELYNIDESFYAASARVWLAGRPPYESFADMKPLLLFAYYRGIFSVFGESMRAVHGVTLLWTVATALALYTAAALLYGPRTARLAALLYTLFPSSFMGVDALAANSEVLFNLPVSLALLAFVAATVRQQDRYYFLSGAAIALAALFNFKAGAPLAAFLFTLAWQATRGQSTPAQAVRRAAFCLAGFALPVAATYLYLYERGVLAEALYWNFTINRLYIRAGVSFSGFLDSLANSLLIFLVFHLLLLVLATRQARQILSARGGIANTAELAILLALLVDILAIALGGRLYGHYLQQLYPPLCLLAAPALADWLDRYRAGSPSLYRRWSTAGFLVPLLAFGLLNYWDYVFRARPHVVLNEADLRSERVGWRLQALTPVDRSLFVWGFSPSIYYHSHRLPASRFIFVGPLVGETPGGRRWTDAEKQAAGQERLWQKLIEDLNRYRPLWVLDTTVDRGFGPSWAQWPMPSIPPLLNWVKTHCTAADQLEGFALWHCH